MLIPWNCASRTGEQISSFVCCFVVAVVSSLGCFLFVCSYADTMELRKPHRCVVFFVCLFVGLSLLLFLFSSLPYAPLFHPFAFFSLSFFHSSLSSLPFPTLTIPLIPATRSRSLLLIQKKRQRRGGQRMSPPDW
jgi:hypothetical protein